MDYYVYGLIDPETELPFYIGKGRKGRARKHINLVKRGKQSGNPEKDAKIERILLSGHEPRIEYYKKGLEENDAYELEEHLILSYGRIGKESNGILYNYHLAHPPIPRNTGRTCFKPGNKPWNKGKRGFTHTDETKQKMSQTRTGRPSPIKGRVQSVEEIAKRSVCLIGRVVSEETRKKIANGNKGKHISLETRSKMSESHMGVARPDISAMQRKRLADPIQLEKHREMCRLREARRRMVRELEKDNRKMT